MIKVLFHNGLRDTNATIVGAFGVILHANKYVVVHRASCMMVHMWVRKSRTAALKLAKAAEYDDRVDWSKGETLERLAMLNGMSVRDVYDVAVDIGKGVK